MCSGCQYNVVNAVCQWRVAVTGWYIIFAVTGRYLVSFYLIFSPSQAGRYLKASVSSGVRLCVPSGLGVWRRSSEGLDIDWSGGISAGLGPSGVPAGA